MLIIPIVSSSQNMKDTVLIEIAVPAIVKDTLGLDFAVSIFNRSKQVIYFYSELKDGYSFDPETNTTFDLEEYVNGNYKYYSVRYINYLSEINDSVQQEKDHFTYLSLRPAEKKRMSYNFAHISGGLDSGLYRIRIYLKVKPLMKKRENFFFRLLNGEEVLESKFIYFRVANDVYIKHNPV